MFAHPNLHDLVHKAKQNEEIHGATLQGSIAEMEYIHDVYQCVVVAVMHHVVDTKWQWLHRDTRYRSLGHGGMVNQAGIRYREWIGWVVLMTAFFYFQLQFCHARKVNEIASVFYQPASLLLAWVMGPTFAWGVGLHAYLRSVAEIVQLAVLVLSRNPFLSVEGAVAFSRRWGNDLLVLVVE